MDKSECKADRDSYLTQELEVGGLPFKCGFIPSIAGPNPVKLQAFIH